MRGLRGRAKTPPSAALTPRQQQIVDFIETYREEHGRSPSYREIAAHLGVASTNTVYCHVLCIERKGRIKREPYEYRNLNVASVKG